MNDKELLGHLENIETSLAILVKLNVSRIIEQTITTEDEKKLYELTGEKGRDDICRMLHLSPNRVSDLWNSWYNLGILRKEGLSYKKTIE